MSVLINSETRVIVKGLQDHMVVDLSPKTCLDYGTKN